MTKSKNDIRILIVDDSALVRQGIRAVCETHRGERRLIVTGEVATEADAVRAAAEQRPDVILLDIQLAGGSGVDACREIMKQQPEARVLMLTSFASDKLLYDSVVAGAKGYLMKEIDPLKLIATIIDAAEGRAVLTTDLTERVMRFLRHGPPPSQEDTSRLSAQERRVLALVAAGHTNRSVGLELGLSENTVKNYLVSVFDKLRVKRRSQAAAIYVKSAQAPDPRVPDLRGSGQVGPGAPGLPGKTQS